MAATTAAATAAAMAPPSNARAATAYRPVTARRHLPLLGLAAAALAWASSTPTGFAGLRLAGSAAGRGGAAVALAAAARPAPEKYGGAQIKTYEGYVYRKKHAAQSQVHIRLDRRGLKHRAFYRIYVQRSQKAVINSGRFLEIIGWWDPFKETDDRNMFSLKCDRAAFWLRNGAQPSDGVANLLDRAGIIRRTGTMPKRGEWEWRVPKNSGPDAPEGWSYDGPQAVTWNNRPKRQRRHFRRQTEGRSPLVERFGFKGYARIPVDQEIFSDPVAGSAISGSFPNTNLPPI